MGLSGIVAQVILLRELLISFLGNELTLGIILANWLILVAVGSFIIGKSVGESRKKDRNLCVFQLIFSVAFPLAIFLCRMFKNILLSTPGEALGFVPIFYSSLLVLIPVTLPYGALFTYGCKLYAWSDGEDASSVGQVYLLETVGSMIGGLLLTFLLIQYFNSFTIAFLIASSNVLMSVILLWLEPGSSEPLSKGSHDSFDFSCTPFYLCLFPQIQARLINFPSGRSGKNSMSSTTKIPSMETSRLRKEGNNTPFSQMESRPSPVLCRIFHSLRILFTSQCCSTRNPNRF